MTDILTNEDIASIVDNEGLGYSVQKYMGSEDFEDRELAEWWSQAKSYLDLIDDRLEEFYP